MRLSLLLLIVLFTASLPLAQEADKSVAEFDKLAHRCADAPDVIEAQRKRLGDRFEAELLKYLGSDVDKHYWVSCSLSGCATPTSDRYLESLSLLIREQALSLLANKDDEHSLYTAVSLHVVAAVQSERLGFHQLAVAHKTETARLVSEQPLLKGGYPAMSKEEWLVYDSLATAVPKKPRRSRGSKNHR